MPAVSQSPQAWWVGTGCCVDTCATSETSRAPHSPQPNGVHVDHPRTGTCATFRAQVRAYGGRAFARVRADQPDPVVHPAGPPAAEHNGAQ